MKNALITGATKGMGKAIAEAFAKEGINIAICSRTAGDLEATKAGLLNVNPGVKVFTAVADGSNKAEFETWATDADVYQTTPQWPVGNTPKLAPPYDCFDATKPGWGNLPEGACIRDDVRHNRSSFDYIVGNNLFSKSGLVQAFQRGLKIDFPADAIEVKGFWMPVSDVRRWHPSLASARISEIFHTSVAQEGASTREYALLGLAISSKQVKNRLCDVRTPHESGRCDDTGCSTASALTPDSGAAGAFKPGLRRMQEERGIERDVRARRPSASPTNYCPKGSQAVHR